MSNPSSSSSSPLNSQTSLDDDLNASFAELMELTTPSASSSATETSTDSFDALLSDLDQSLSSESDHPEIIDNHDFQEFSDEDCDRQIQAEESMNDWFTIAHQLRQHNRELMSQLEQLQQTVAHSSQLSDPRPETLSANESDLQQQLLASQKQAAQLERDCALLKEDNNRQIHQLLENEQEIRELRSRLYRQQRYTLKFKAALEQLENESDVSETLEQSSEESSTSKSVVPEPSPIQPWSATENTIDINPLQLARLSAEKEETATTVAEMPTPKVSVANSTPVAPPKPKPVISHVINSKSTRRKQAIAKKKARGNVDLPKF